MESGTYKILELAGTWFEAVGTCSAVIVALYLSRKDHRPALQVSAEDRILVRPGSVADRSRIQPNEWEDLIYLEVVNVGPVNARVNGVGWHWWLIRGLGAYQNPPGPAKRSNGEWPVTLAPGEQIQWQLEPDLCSALAKAMLATSWWWQLKLRLLRVQAYTTTGRRFRGRVGPLLRKRFAEETRRLRAQRRQ